MDATTLRLGNVLLDHDGQLCKVYELHTDKTCTTINGFKQDPANIRQFKSVRIRKEHLIKLGFQHSCDREYKLLCKDGYVLYNLHNCIFTYSHTAELCEFRKWIMTLNQLQNLYFSLTGEELNTEKLFDHVQPID